MFIKNSLHINSLSLHRNYISLAHMQINAFIHCDAWSVQEDLSSVILSRELSQTTKTILSSEPTSLNRFQVKDTYWGNFLPGLCFCTFPRTIYIIHCLQPESRDLYKEQADRQRENRWHFISCRERESVCKRARERGRVSKMESMEYSMSSVSYSLENTFGAEVII